MSISWRERLSEGQVIPHFQPIVSLESTQIEAYEALGRHWVGPEFRSLGPFFASATREPGLADFRKDIDRTLRRAALTALKGWNDPQLRLFLNVTPKLMAEHLREGASTLPWTLRVVEELGLDPRRVVIELTEEAIDAETASLRRLVDLYRAHGCGIAVDDVGAESSNLDRIGYFEPDIIKVDAAMLRRSLEHRSFRQVLHGVSAMAEGLGAALLFEGVESAQDLDQALSFGARYAQGWFFSKAGPEPLDPGLFSPALQASLRNFGRGLTDTETATRLRIRETIEALGRPPEPVRLADGTWGFAPGALDFWGLGVCRVFVTDRAGFQVSANYEAGCDGWTTNLRSLGWSRAMRPYFPGGGDARWAVSDRYYDSNDRSLVRTYSRPVGPDLLLFVDVLEIENQDRSD